MATENNNSQTAEITAVETALKSARVSIESTWEAETPMEGALQTVYFKGTNVPREYAEINLPGETIAAWEYLPSESGERTVCIQRLAPNALGVLNADYPEYSDDEWDGYATLAVHVFPSPESLDERLPGFLEGLAQEAIAGAADTTVSVYKQTQPHATERTLAQAILKATDRGMDQDARIRLYQELRNRCEDAIETAAKDWLRKRLEGLAQLEFESGSEYDDAGGYYRVVERVTLTRVSGCFLTISFDSDWGQALEYAELEFHLGLNDQFEDREAAAAAIEARLNEMFGADGTPWEEIWDTIVVLSDLDDGPFILRDQRREPIGGDA